MRAATLVLALCAASAALAACEDPADGLPPCSEEHADRTLGLISCRPDAHPGYTLFAPVFWTSTYLIDMQGRLINSWPSKYLPGQSAYLLEDGLLLRTAFDDSVGFTHAGGNGGRVQLLDWDGTVVWDYLHCEKDRYCQHHDVAWMPNGHVLLLVWERKTLAEVAAAGFDLTGWSFPEMLVDKVVEVERTGPSSGKVVWEWRVWDHLIQDFDATKANYGEVKSHPELLDFNYAAIMTPYGDKTHVNSIDYNPALDQILLSMWGTNEIFIIDHSTTTAEARGHTGGKRGKGGDILYRWGNPAAHRAGGAKEHQLFCQHDATWIRAGLPGADNILLFNNGLGRQPPFSSVVELRPPLQQGGGYALTAGKACGPSAPTWTYQAPKPTDFFSAWVSSAQRLPNGDTLFVDATKGELLEVTASGELVWRYVSPVGNAGPKKQGTKLTFPWPTIYKARRYSPGYSGLAGRDLTPQSYVELPGP